MKQRNTQVFNILRSHEVSPAHQSEGLERRNGLNQRSGGHALSNPWVISQAAGDIDEALMNPRRNRDHFA